MAQGDAMLLRGLLVPFAVLCCAVPRLLTAAPQGSPLPGATGASPGQFELYGRVLDPAGASIAGARVSAARSGGVVPETSAVSDQNGEFTLQLPSGRYMIRIVADGFAEMSQLLDAKAGAESRQYVLQLAGVRETVTVAGGSSYRPTAISSGTRTLTPLRDVPQSITVITRELMADQLMSSISDVVRYVPGVTAHQGENNRDQVIIRGTNSSADFFLNGIRDDVQYYRDLYNLDRVEALKGPNAMIFGRGGGGGVINRVTKEPLFVPMREITLQGGSFGNRRFTTDLNQPLRSGAAFRLNGMYENSDSFRNGIDLERYGINPSLTIAPAANTRIALGYEHLHDRRTADRGIPSFQGRPADVSASTFFGDPDNSHVRADVNLASASIDHRRGALNIHNRTLAGGYDRGYQNYVPGAVTADKRQTALSAYNNATRRVNFFNQTDFSYAASSGQIRHTFLVGAEVGRQLTDNFRNTGYFNNTTTSVLVPYANPTIARPVTFRQSATDADNHVQTDVAAAYAQDQIEVSRAVQVIAGLRFDRFDIQYHNNRTADDLRRIDHLVSPRTGIVVTPIAPLSLYGSYTVSYLPSSGDQFSSLTTITQQVKPEQFSNYELGAKWDVQPALSLTTAVYRLDRTNTRSTDSNDPTRIVQTGSQRTNGYEFGIQGRLSTVWQIVGGYAYQHAFVTSATAAAPPGAQVAQVPHHTVSIWSRYQLHPAVAVGLGMVSRTDMYAAIDDTVTLPGYADLDAALYVSLSRRMSLQTNVENLFDKKYYVNADNNTNISPGSPRAVRVALIARF
jgi:catecholate siderophore receptor